MNHQTQIRTSKGLSTENLSNGLYFVELGNEEGLVDVKRIVKQ